MPRPKIKKKSGPNERTDQSFCSEKIQLSDKEIANLSDADAQFKTLVIMMLTALVEYGCKIEEKVKAMKSEMKKTCTGNQQ